MRKGLVILGVVVTAALGGALAYARTPQAASQAKPAPPAV